MHPAVKDPANALDYYWEIQSSGITGYNGTLSSIIFKVM